MSSGKSELITIMEQMERDKGIKKEEILSLVQNAIVSAYKRQQGRDIEAEAVIDPQTGSMSAFVIKTVVENPSSPSSSSEISLVDARRYDAAAAIGGKVKIPIDVSGFLRIAAQTARQVIVQKIKEKEKEALVADYSKRIGEIMSGNVFKFSSRAIIVDIGKTEAVLPPEEQVPGERFSIGKHIRAVLLRIDDTPKGPQLILSRRDPLFVKKLFELEIPEIYEKVVEIIKIEREPGLRTKMIVDSKNPRVDAVGACIGIRGARIRPIIDELGGEKIDLIHNNPRDLVKMIEEAISPAKDIQISVVSTEQKTAEIIAPDSMLSLAIGRHGHNIRLASKITGWNLNVISETADRERSREKAQGRIEAVSKIKGIGEKTSEVLAKAGFLDASKIASATVEELTALQGIGEKTAEKIIAAARAALKDEEDKGGENNEEKNKAEAKVKESDDSGKETSPDHSDSSGSKEK